MQRALLVQQVLSLWALLLCRLTGQDEMVIGLPYHGRDVAVTGGVGLGGVWLFDGLARAP